MTEKSTKTQRRKGMKFNIENYENMTVEEKLAALEAYEPDMSGYVSKAVFDKTASEAASFKKQLREKMSEDEAKAAKEAEDRAALIARVAELEKEQALNGYVTSYMAIGYDEKLAKSSAEAMANGDMATVFANQKSFTAAQEKALRAELLKKTPEPPAGDASGAMKKEAFAKLSLLEKQKFAAENPETYKEFYGGN
jgi:hypothetical protein